MNKIVVLASGNGSNLQAVIDSCKSGILKSIAQVSCVISNNAEAFALERAKKENISAYCIKDNVELFDFLKKTNCDLICLAGYLRLIDKNIVERFIGKILNIHPSLLPKFGGKGMFGHFVHEAVFLSGEKKTGPTVHFVDEVYDNGKIVLQKEIDILENDNAQSISKKVLKIEHEIYPIAIKKVLDALEVK
jgi:phosphoribosylglycinamide formyltransferase-1